jgi:hypothetical protein
MTSTQGSVETEFLLLALSLSVLLPQWTTQEHPSQGSSAEDEDTRPLSSCWLLSIPVAPPGSPWTNDEHNSSFVNIADRSTGLAIPWATIGQQFIPYFEAWAKWRIYTKMVPRFAMPNLRWVCWVHVVIKLHVVSRLGCVFPTCCSGPNNGVLLLRQIKGCNINQCPKHNVVGKQNCTDILHNTSGPIVILHSICNRPVLSLALIE